MSANSIPPILPGEMPPAEAGSSFTRLRASIADSLFFVSRAFPKLLTLPSGPSAWTGLRILLGAAGAALVVLPLSLWNAWAFAPVGLALFMLAVLLPPLRHDRGTAQAIEKLGAYLVLEGGNFSDGSEAPPAVNFYLTPTRVWALDDQLRPIIVIPADAISMSAAFFSDGDEAPPAVNFYLTPTRVWALDDQLRPIIVIPADAISMAAAFCSQGDWLLRVRWQENSAEFIFRGLFGERRARLTESGLRHLIQQTEPSRARVKAAGA